MRKDNSYNSRSKYLHSIRGNNTKQLTEHIKNIINCESETSIATDNDEYFDKYLQYIITTESHDAKEYDDSSNNEEQINKYRCVVYNINYKNALNCNKHIGDDDTCSIYHRFEAILHK